MAWTTVELMKLVDAQEMKTRTLPGEAAAHADVPNLTTLHDIMQRLHGLFDGLGVRETVMKTTRKKAQPVHTRSAGRPRGYQARICRRPGRI